MKEKIKNLLKKAKPYSAGFFMGILIWLIINYPKVKEQFLVDKFETIEDIKEYATKASKLLDQNLINQIAEVKKYVAENLPENLNMSKEEVIDTLNKVVIIPVGKKNYDHMQDDIGAMYIYGEDLDLEMIFLNKIYLKESRLKYTLIHELYHFIDRRRDTSKTEEYNNAVKILLDTTISEDRFKKILYFVLKNDLNRISKNFGKNETNKLLDDWYTDFNKHKRENYFFSKEEIYARLNTLKYKILSPSKDKKITSDNFLKFVKTIRIDDDFSEMFYCVLLLNNINNIELLNEI